MKTKYTAVFAIAMLFIFVGAIQAQYNFYPDSRWSVSSAVYPSGSYVQLPTAPPTPLPVTQTRVYQTPIGVLSVNPSIQILPNNSWTQTEVPIVCCRTNQALMFASSNSVPITGATINSGSYISTNSGLNWFGQEYINNGNTANQRGDPGPTYDKNQRVIFTHLAASQYGAV